MSINFSGICDYFLDKEKEKEEKISKMIEKYEEEGFQEIETQESKIFSGICEQNEEASLIMTNFTSLEVLELFSVVETNLQPSKRGRKPTTSPLDSFFLVLVCLKHYEIFDKMAVQFKLNKHIVQNLIKPTLQKIAEPLSEQFIKIISKEEQNKQKIKFANFSEANSVSDVTFQPIPKQSDFKFGKVYFSGKHHSYGVKVETCNAPNGLLMMHCKHYPGSVHDFTIFKDNVNNYKTYILKKSLEEIRFEDNGELVEIYKKEWGMLLDKAYISATNLIRAIIPTKKKDLSIIERRRNDKIASDRVIVENFYGRMKKLFKIMYDVFRWDLQLYDSVFTVCAALTNFHILKNPLRKEDGDVYNSYIRHWIDKGNVKAEKKRKYNSEYQEKRKRRLFN